MFGPSRLRHRALCRDLGFGQTGGNPVCPSFGKQIGFPRMLEMHREVLSTDLDEGAAATAHAQIRLDLHDDGWIRPQAGRAAKQTTPGDRADHRAAPMSADDLGRPMCKRRGGPSCGWVQINDGSLTNFSPVLPELRPRATASRDLHEVDLRWAANARAPARRPFRCRHGVESPGVASRTKVRSAALDAPRLRPLGLPRRSHAGNHRGEQRCRDAPQSAATSGKDTSAI